MQKLILGFFILFSISSWAQTEFNQDSVIPAVTRMVYQTKSTIIIKQYDQGFDHEVTDGKNWVFSYFHKGQDYVYTSDDEFSEYFMFEVKPKCRKFNLTSADFTNAKFIYNRGCFCPETGNFNIKIGSVKAKKIGKNKWQLNIVFTVEPRDPNGMMVAQEKTINGVFEMGKINRD